MNFKTIMALIATVATATAATTTTFATDGNAYATYPPVPKTASINGFADPIYTKIPECAQACVAEDTGSTPCPYWDTGCLCIMSNWNGVVADCVASACSGNDVVTFTSLATSLCSSAGDPSPYWFIPATASAALATAAA